MRHTIAAFAATLLATVAAPALAQGSPPPGILPDTVTPTAYRLDFTVDPKQPRFTGHTEIDIMLKAPASAIWLHGRDLTVTRVQGLTGRMVADPGHYRQVLPTGVAQIRFDRPLQAGRHTLVIDYTAPFNTGASGLYHVKVGDQWYAYTQFESIDARRAFPGFDQPGYKTPFTVKIAAPADQYVVSNAPETGDAPQGTMKLHTYAPTKPLPTYLVALAVGPFDVVYTSAAPNSVRAEPLKMRGIAERGQKDRLAFTMENAPKLTSLLEEYFGIAYPYPKLDLVASPIMGGAMENAGMITYDDSIILVDKNAPPRQTLSLGSVVAHEIAHQWFGDLVTPRWWDDIWLNESFATWAAEKIASRWNPAAGADVADLNGALRTMNLDSQSAGRPIRQRIDRNEQIDSAFDSITYEKGGQVLRMMEGYVGEDAFQKGVHLHLTRYAYGTATGDQFFASIAEGSGKPGVIPAFRSFVEQQGVPLITVRAASGGTYTLTQERYVPIGVKRGAPQLWQVPVCARAGEARECTLLTGRTGTLALNGTAPWIMPNAGGRGYYRFDLDPASWDALIAAGPGLAPTEAMATADSLWASFTAGRAPFAQVVAGARSLATHKERYAATFLPSTLAALSQTEMTATDRDNYGRMVHTLFAPRLAELGLDLRAGAYKAEASERRELRRVLANYVADEGKDTQARGKFVSATQAYLGGDTAALDPAFRPLGLQIVAKDGGLPMVQKLFDRLIASTDPQERSEIVQALSSVDRADLAPRVLELRRDSRLNNLEGLRMGLGLAFDASTRDIAYTSAIEHFDTMAKATPLIASFLLGIGSGYCSEDRARRVEADLRPKVASLHLSPLELDRSVETIRKCAAIKAAKGSEISAGLASFR